MTVVSQEGDRRSLDDAVDERRPLLGESRGADGKAPQEDGTTAMYVASEAVSSRIRGDEPPRKPWGPLMVLLALTVRMLSLTVCPLLMTLTSLGSTTIML